MSDLRQRVLDQAPGLGSVLAAWFDHMAEPDAYYELLSASEANLDRAAHIAQNAPVLVEFLANSPEVTASIVGGSLEEDEQPEYRVVRLAANALPKDVAAAARSAWLSACCQWVLGIRHDLGSALSRLADTLLNHIAGRLCAEYDIIAVGSYGLDYLAPDSDLDAFLLVDDGFPQADAEEHAQQLVALYARLRGLGAPFEFDPFLRNEGKHGLLVRTYSGFESYELERMDMNERFVLGQARMVRGNPDGLQRVIHAAYALPVTPERLMELVRMKRRIETEQNQPKYFRRNVKIGYGGLTDIEWFTHLFEMRFPTATKAGTPRLMDDRLRAIAHAELLNAFELEALLEARRHLVATRNWLWFMGFADDIVPENPAKLDRLAHAMHFKDGNEFLRAHENAIEAVRGIYVEGLERLKVQA